MPDDPRFLRLARSISECETVDWTETTRSTSDAQERDVVQCLRVVENIARFHQSWGSPVGDESRAARGASREPRPAAPAAGSRRAEDPGLRRWGHLEILEKIGEGVFGEVYRAWETTLAREVALKLLRADAQTVAMTLAP